MDITEVKQKGEVRQRWMDGTQYTNQGFSLRCDACIPYNRKYYSGGLSPDTKAENPTDLCVGAKVQGWLLATHGTFCPACKYRIFRCWARLFFRSIGWGFYQLAYGWGRYISPWI
jgi:hypothetical protein